ncbi:MAG: hypothetical protein DYG90_03885 [Chloroflexi bacterium CFX6]|nr:hypothetical protein [Chloroflexi bacterium CFX6]
MVKHAPAARPGAGAPAEPPSIGAIGPPTVTDLLARGIGIAPPSDIEMATDVPPGDTCAITGAPLGGVGYRCSDIVTDAVSEFIDTFNGRATTGYLSVSAAACFRSANPRTGNPTARGHLAIDTGNGNVWYASPMVSRESAAKQGRPCWSDAVRAVWPELEGRVALVLITDDFKRRCWPYATVGALGSRTPVYLRDGALFGVESVVRVDWPALLDCLDAVERVYALGFSKPAIRDGLLHSTRAVNALGSVVAAVRLECDIAPRRGTPEFQVALVIAQPPAAEEGRTP